MNARHPGEFPNQLLHEHKHTQEHKHTIMLSVVMDDEGPRLNL